MELTNACNSRCIECPNRFMKRKRRVMSDEVLEKIFSDYLPSLKNEEAERGYPPTIILHKDGEPLLHPNFEAIVRTISEIAPKFRFNIYTNGLLLTDGIINMLGSLPNLTWLYVSYHFFNFDGSVNDYAKTNYVVWRGIEKKLDNVAILATSHITRFASREFLEAWESDWRSNIHDGIEGAYGLMINNHINPWTGLIEEENCVTFDGCPYQDFGHLFIGVTGNVIPCCMDLEEVLSVGNILEESKDVLFERMSDFYSKLSTNLPNLCRKCMGKI